ncbi:unnamed protein product [Protopolystoma xenopodis]|uniref:Protein kinase domain-containing protein n=1 Tax=Protopolystoma xenopodis TaxID=117903 RepID=A0A3S5B3G6_9PLAT|nr:unnamed protein product [Protopolystoma xenopodis]
MTHSSGPAPVGFVHPRRFTAADALQVTDAERRQLTQPLVAIATTSAQVFITVNSPPRLTKHSESGSIIYLPSSSPFCRDLKVENILLSEDDHVKIIDHRLDYDIHFARCHHFVTCGSASSRLTTPLTTGWESHTDGSTHCASRVLPDDGCALQRAQRLADLVLEGPKDQIDSGMTCVITANLYSTGWMDLEVGEAVKGSLVFN